MYLVKFAVFFHITIYIAEIFFYVNHDGENFSFRWGANILVGGTDLGCSLPTIDLEALFTQKF